MTKSHEKMVFFDYFDAKYLINLPERTDRLKYIQAQFKKHRLPLSETILFKAVKCQEKGDFDCPGVRGCFLSHLEVLKDAAARKAEKVLIMEDDLGLCRDFFAYQRHVVQELKTKKWDLAYFGTAIPKRKNAPELPGITRVLPWQMRARKGTHFYAVHGKILSRLIVFLEAMLCRPAGSREGGPMNYDGALGWFREQNQDVVTLASRRVLGIQSSSPSDIHPGGLINTALFYFISRPIRRLKNIIMHGC